MITIFSDGGSRGNPGEAACAYVIYNGKELIKQDAKYLGKATNNFAEYFGVIFALEGLLNTNYFIKKDFVDELCFKMDSELVVKQLKGIYKIKSHDLQELAMKVKSIIKDNNLKINFVHVPRAHNKLADKLVNKELDKN